MTRRVTYTMQFHVDDDVTDAEISAMLGAAYAQIEDARVTLDDDVERDVPIIGSIVETTDVQYVGDDDECECYPQNPIDGRHGHACPLYSEAS